MYAASLLFIPMGSYMPSGVGVLWVSNSAVAIAQVWGILGLVFPPIVGVSRVYGLSWNGRAEGVQLSCYHLPGVG